MPPSLEPRRLLCHGLCRRSNPLPPTLRLRWRNRRHPLSRDLAFGSNITFMSKTCVSKKRPVDWPICLVCTSLTEFLLVAVCD